MLATASPPALHLAFSAECNPVRLSRSLPTVTHTCSETSDKRFTRESTILRTNVLQRFKKKIKNLKKKIKNKRTYILRFTHDVYHRTDWRMITKANTVYRTTTVTVQQRLPYNNVDVYLTTLQQRLPYNNVYVYRRTSCARRARTNAGIGKRLRNGSSLRSAGTMFSPPRGMMSMYALRTCM